MATPIVTAYISKTGTQLVLVIASSTGLPTTSANITAVTHDPVVLVNGSSQAIGAATWCNSSHDQPTVHYQLQDGSGNQIRLADTDVVTYSLASGAYTTALGTTPAVTAGTAAANYVGRNEPGVGGVTDFGGTPTMPIGFNMGNAGFYYAATILAAKNARLRFGVPFTQGTGVVYDSVTQEPLYESPGTISAWTYWNTSVGNGVDALGTPNPMGVHSVTFKDTNALDATNYRKVWLHGTSNCGGCDLATGPNTGTGTTYVRSVAADGVTVTVSYWITAKQDPYVHGYNFALYWYSSSASGYWSKAGSGGAAGSGPISQIWAFAPGDSDTTPYASTYSATTFSSAPYTSGYSGTLYNGPFPLTSGGNDTSDPYAISNYFRSVMTASNGRVPYSFRGQGSNTGVFNWQVAADLQPATLWSYTQGTITPNTITITSIRPYDTSVQTKVYQPWFAGDGTDYPTVGGNNPDAGNYIDLSLHGGTSDNGAFRQLLQGGTVMECVCSAPHNRRSGDILTFPSTASTPYLIPCTGISGVALGAVTVVNGSGSITLHTSATIANNTCVVFNLDTTNQAYRIATGGTGTAFTITPVYQGPSSSDGSTTATTTAAADIHSGNYDIWVTGADTFMILPEGGYGSTGTSVATATVTMGSYPIVPYNGQATIAPYEWWVKLAVEFGAIPWISVFPTMSTDCAVAVVDKIASLMPANSQIYVELANELWNNGYVGGVIGNTMGNLLQYLTEGTVVSDYITVGASTSTFAGSSGRMLSCLAIAAKLWDAMQARFDAIGTGIKIIRFANTQYVSSSVTAKMIPGGQTITGSLAKKIGVGAIGLGTYLATETQSTWATAFAAWPIDAISDLLRHWAKYSTTNQGYLSSQKTQIATYATASGPTGYAGQVGGVPSMIGYEGGPGTIRPSLPTGCVNDLFYHPSYYDLLNAMNQSLQDGDPKQAGSGLQAFVYTAAGGNWDTATPQTLLLWQGQPVGRGSANVFSTAQGGTAGVDGYGVAYDLANESVGMQAMLDWTAGLTPSTSPIVVTLSATSVTATTATLNATVNPNGTDTSADFIYGTDPTLTTGTTTTTPQDVGSGSMAVAINAAISGLTGGTPYYFRVSGTNTGGTSEGMILTFLTTPEPPVLTVSIKLNPLRTQVVSVTASLNLDPRQTVVASLTNK